MRSHHRDGCSNRRRCRSASPVGEVPIRSGAGFLPCARIRTSAIAVPKMLLSRRVLGVTALTDLPEAPAGYGIVYGGMAPKEFTSEPAHLVYDDVILRADPISTDQDAGGARQSDPSRPDAGDESTPPP